MGKSLDERIVKRGSQLLAGIRGEAPTLFNRGWWAGKVMDLAMSSEPFKVQLFRFVDCLPALKEGEALARHIEEYFGGEEADLPRMLRLGAKGVSLGEGAAGKLLGQTLRTNIEKMGRLFIAGATADEAVRTLRALRRAGYAFTVDILGEATLSETEAHTYRQRYLDLLDRLKREREAWTPLGREEDERSATGLDWGHAPVVNVSVKPTAFSSRVRPEDFEGSVAAICASLRPVLARARDTGAHLNLDMEQHRVKDITLEVFRRLRADDAFRDYPYFGLVLQAYHVDAEEDLDALLSWSEREDLALSIRLVKGAYWDYETVIARQYGWKVPVHTRKAATDAAFERLAARILANHRRCYLAAASHNIRAIAAVMETADSLGVPESAYEFQVLYGMAEPVRRSLLKEAGRVRLYAPFGELLPGLSYLVRRLLENTSNESFVRRRFAEGEDEKTLLASPSSLLEAETVDGTAAGTPPGPAAPRPFVNHPLADFTRSDLREGFTAALAAVKGALGATYPLSIGGREIETDDRLASVNPADPAEVIGEVCQAGKAEIDLAVEAAGEALDAWRDLTAAKRAELLLRAAEIARREIALLSAWQILEVGKQWDQAYGDVAEAVDYFEYYAREAIRFGGERVPGTAPGEANRYFYQPKGIAAIIAPWNFPLAISAGMTAAALAAGNCVLYKPSGLSPVTGSHLTRIYREAGIPAGVFSYLPGRGGVIGDYLVEHPAISLIAFTGSMEVGLGIVRRAAPVREGQRMVKKVVAEMGGKNAIIVDEDADLDEAVAEVLRSAFGYQGQKCSACSRVIVLEPVRETFAERLVEAARSLQVGPAEDPANFCGPVIDEEARGKIRRYVEIGRTEGRPLLLRDESPGPGFYAPLAIFGGIEQGHRLAREEIFGPVLALMEAGDFAEALALANSTAYALTGAVFSRSPRNLERAAREFRVGNLYLNRGCTGALVARQPFGGFGMSGIGSKAGGPDYLLQFMDPRTVTENTMRRGFAPSPGA